MRKGPFGSRVLLSFSSSPPSLSSLILCLRHRFSLFYYPSAALRCRQVGSLLRNGFPNFFATIKGPRRSGIAEWGMASVAPYIEGELELPPCRTCTYSLTFKICRRITQSIRKFQYASQSEKIHVRVHQWKRI